MAGVTLGLTVNAILSSLGLSALLTTYPSLTRWIGFAGAGMMVWLAWNAWHDTGESSTGRLPTQQAGKHFTLGFVLNLLNVKAALFFLSVVPQFITAGRSNRTEILVLGMVSVSIATLVHLALVLGASRARVALAKPGRTRSISRGLSIIMLAVAVWFLWGAIA